jgi:hypothetical protein
VRARAHSSLQVVAIAIFCATTDLPLRPDFLPIAKVRSYNTNKEVFQRLPYAGPVTWRSLMRLFSRDLFAAVTVGLFCYGMNIFVSFFLFQVRRWWW